MPRNHIAGRFWLALTFALVALGGVFKVWDGHSKVQVVGGTLAAVAGAMASWISWTHSPAAHRAPPADAGDDVQS